jgi:hypothetical protein
MESNSGSPETEGGLQYLYSNPEITFMLIFKLNAFRNKESG